MSIDVTCPRCQAAARVPEDMLGQVVRCPHCLMPFRTPASMPESAPPPNESSAPPPEEPPLVAVATGPIDDVATRVVRVRRPIIATATKKRAKTNAGLRTGLAIGTAVFLIFAVVGAGLFIMAVGHERRPTFHRGFMQPPPQMPAERLGPGDRAAGVPEFVTRSLPKPKSLANVRLPDSREHRAALAGPRRALPGGFAITPVQLDDAKDIMGLCWTANADAFLILSSNGELRRVDYPSLEETRRLDVGQRCGELTMSGEGVLVTLPRLEEVWVIDPEGLAVRRRIGVAGLRDIVSGPDLAIAFAFVTGDVDGVAPLRIDLTTGVVSAVALFQRTDGAGNAPAHHFSMPALTADGRFLFTGFSGPSRYRVEDDRLTYEAADLRPRRTMVQTVVSADGRWVGAAGGVYTSDDLDRPALELPETATAVGFDPDAQRVLISGPDQMLTIFDLADRHRAAARWPDRPASARQLLVHPRGEGVLLRTDIGVLRVETPAP